MTCLWTLLLWLCLLNPACTDQGFFDRYDACEKWVSLCQPWHPALTSCVEWIEENLPDDQRLALLLECVPDASTCEEITEGCTLNP